jgi:hypothetical protein
VPGRGYPGHAPRVAAAAALAWSAGDWGSKGGYGGSGGGSGTGMPGAGSRGTCFGGEAREHSGGGTGQRAYLRGPGEAGDTSWWRRLVLCACTFLSEKSPLGFRGAFFYCLSREEFWASRSQPIVFLFGTCGPSGADGRVREA